MFKSTLELQKYRVLQTSLISIFSRLIEYSNSMIISRGANRMNDNITFNERCYQLLKLVPEGKVTTYGEIARALDTRAWRAVGSAMAKNRNLFIIPCHRVVRSDGTIGQYALGPEKKADLLRHEGVEIVNGKVKEIGKYIHTFSS